MSFPRGQRIDTFRGSLATFVGDKLQLMVMWPEVSDDRPIEVLRDAVLAAGLDALDEYAELQTVVSECDPDLYDSLVTANPGLRLEPDWILN